MNKVVKFKGVSGGVNLEILDVDIEKIKKSIENIMYESQDFFEGTKLLNITGEHISLEDTLDLIYMLKYKYNFIIGENCVTNKIQKIMKNEELITKEDCQKVTKDDNIDVEYIKKTDIELIKEGMTKFVHGTLRSGQSIVYYGNIVIIGDVNPGGEVKASGNIIVLGTLRGIAYAGLNGNKEAVVAAYNLLPTQLKIADIIVRSPDEEEYEYGSPEVAKIIGDKIIIEPYLPNK